MLRHALERYKHSNTGRLVGLAVRGARVVDWAVRGEPLPELTLGDDAQLLWPEGPVAVAPPTAPVHLVVLDGTWPQARRMVQRISGLRGVRRLALAPPAHALVRLRRTRTAEEMSTLEAVAQALGFLEGPAVAAPLRALHDAFVRASQPLTSRRGGIGP